MRRLTLPSDLEDISPSLHGLLLQEADRVNQGVEFIASESYPHPSVVEVAGNVFTAKYQEGFPYRRVRGVIDTSRPSRYYGGTDIYDQVELMAIENALSMFGLRSFGEAWACVQPHSGTDANIKAYFTVASMGDRAVGLDLSMGGHLTYGSPVSLTSKLFNWQHYGVDQFGYIDWLQFEDVIRSHKPRFVVVGGSALVTAVDFQLARELVDRLTEELGQPIYLIADIAHPAGLMAARVGLFEDPRYLPWEYCDLITTTTHKTLRGISGGLMIIPRDDLRNRHGDVTGKGTDRRLSVLAEAVVFPGSTGKALGNVVAAKALSFQLAGSSAHRRWAQQVLDNTGVLADTLKGADIPIFASEAGHGGTQNHCLLVDVDAMGLTSHQAEQALAAIHMTVNVNTIPDFTGRAQSPKKPLGIRLGMPALTCRDGFGNEATEEVALLMAQALKQHDNPDALRTLHGGVVDLMLKHPLYGAEA